MNISEAITILNFIISPPDKAKVYHLHISEAWVVVKSEIERLKDEIAKLKSEVNNYKQRYESSEKRYFELTQSVCEALKAKEEHFQEKGKKVENNMKSVLEIEKKQAVKEFAEKLKAKAVQEAEVEDYVCYIVNRILKEYEK